MNRDLAHGEPIACEGAASFLSSKGIQQEYSEQGAHNTQGALLVYARTIFNVDTYAEVADLFFQAPYWVKTAVGGEVVEWYKQGYTTPEGEEVFGVSLDLHTNEPIDVYRTNEASIPDLALQVSKTSPSGKVTLTHCYSYLQLPVDVQEKLKDHPFKDSICMYSEKPYGRFVEYMRTW